MKLTYTAYKFPRGVASVDLKLSRGSRLLAKVIVFKNMTAMRAAFKKYFDSELGNGCMAAVHDLAREVVSFREGEESKHLEVDKKYYCVIGFTLEYLNMEIICHECVHAGYAYEKRVRRDVWAPINSIDEERVAYPAGKLARQINKWLWKNNLYATE